jgi:nucleoside triphosphate diphosphatase
MPKTFTDLVTLMTRLRAPGGCPWDREQTYATLAPMLLEEAYEAFEAVETARAGEPEALRDELGDLLFQVVFYAQVAAERGEFTIADVTDAVHSKMVRRHPHVFGDAQAEDTATVLRNWEAIKAAEKRAADNADQGTGETTRSILEGVSTKIPALMEGHQLSTKAARLGFDWEKTDDIFDKLEEEIAELRSAIGKHQSSNAEADHIHIREELGDLLFVVTNLARHLRVEPEAALKLTNRKFRRRFHYIEQSLSRKRRAFSECSLAELEELWQQAKEEEGRLAAGISQA